MKNRCGNCRYAIAKNQYQITCVIDKKIYSVEFNCINFKANPGEEDKCTGN